jgi:hypothetical protein
MVQSIYGLTIDTKPIDLYLFNHSVIALNHVSLFCFIVHLWVVESVQMELLKSNGFQKPSEVVD